MTKDVDIEGSAWMNSTSEGTDTTTETVSRITYM